MIDIYLEFSIHFCARTSDVMILRYSRSIERFADPMLRISWITTSMPDRRSLTFRGFRLMLASKATYASFEFSSLGSTHA